MSGGAFVEGDVVRYAVKERHCREGMAIARLGRDNRVRLFDTFWNGGGRHLLTDDESARAELQFNLADYRPIDRSETWVDFHPDQRVEVTHQHGLQRDKYVRHGAEPHMPTRIENARERVEEAERELASATRWVEWRKQELDELLVQVPA